jgi:ADP-heptose:LPS heptosyltransferase
MQDSGALRFVDRYAGTSLCGVLSAIHGFSRLRKKPRRDPVRRVLLVELFEMGAAVMLAPSIRHLRAQGEQMELHCLTTTTCFPIWQHMGLIDADKIHVIDARSSMSFVLSSLAAIIKLRKLSFDIILDYELFMRVPAVLVGLLRAKARAGFFRYELEGLYRGSFYQHLCSYNQNSHISKNLLALTKTACSDAQDIPNFKGALSPEELQIQASPVASIAGLFPQVARPYIAICPDVGKSLAMRNYPSSSFADLILRLFAAYPSHQVVLLGTQENSASCEELRRKVGDDARCIDMSGKTSFRELTQLIAGADLLITNDNGPAHFAALSGTKTLALFSTDSPFVYGPLGKAVVAYSFFHCSPCVSAFNHKKSGCRDNKCLQALSPSRVFELAKSILEGTARFGTINGQIPYVL